MVSAAGVSYLARIKCVASSGQSGARCELSAGAKNLSVFLRLGLLNRKSFTAARKPASQTAGHAPIYDQRTPGELASSNFLAANGQVIAERK